MMGIILQILFFTVMASESAKQDLIHAYEDEVASYGAQLMVEYLPDNSKKAHASREGKLWKVVIGGGFLNWREGDGALRLLLCHELGHHLGGAPYKFPRSEKLSWISAEGQADYFAAKDCALRLMNEDAAIAAAEQLARHWWASQRRPRNPRPELDQKSKHIARKTLTRHPEPQCRLDTYLAGLNCKDSEDCRPGCWFKSP